MWRQWFISSYFIYAIVDSVIFTDYKTIKFQYVPFWNAYLNLYTKLLKELQSEFRTLSCLKAHQVAPRFHLWQGWEGDTAVVV